MKNICDRFPVEGRDTSSPIRIDGHTKPEILHSQDDPKLYTPNKSSSAPSIPDRTGQTRCIAQSAHCWSVQVESVNILPWSTNKFAFQREYYYLYGRIERKRTFSRVCVWLGIRVDEPKSKLRSSSIYLFHRYTILTRIHAVCLARLAQMVLDHVQRGSFLTKVLLNNDRAG